MRPLIKVPLVNGVIAGALGAVLTIVLYYLSSHPFLIPVYLDFRILLFGFFIFFTLKEFRDLHQEGILYFWQGLIASFIFVNVFGIVAGGIIWIFALTVPVFVSEYISQQLETLRNIPNEVIERIGKDVYDRNLELLPATNAFDLASLYFTQSLIIGFFISIILSVILRRQPKI